MAVGGMVAIGQGKIRFFGRNPWVQYHGGGVDRHGCDKKRGSVRRIGTPCFRIEAGSSWARNEKFDASARSEPTFRLVWCSHLSESRVATARNGAQNL